MAVGAEAVAVAARTEAKAAVVKATVGRERAKR